MFNAWKLSIVEKLGIYLQESKFRSHLFAAIFALPLGFGFIYMIFALYFGIAFFPAYVMAYDEFGFGHIRTALAGTAINLPLLAWGYFIMCNVDYLSKKPRNLSRNETSSTWDQIMIYGIAELVLILLYIENGPITW